MEEIRESGLTVKALDQQEVKNGPSNIMVAVRMRPLWKNEIENNEVSIVNILDGTLVILRDPQDFDDD